VATVRQRGRTFHYVVRKKGVLPRPVYLTFDNREEGDAYVKHLEALLDKGIVPDAFREVKGKVSTISHAIAAYSDGRHIPESDQLLLAVLDKRVGNRSLVMVDYHWAEEWIAGMKAAELSPSTIRHYVGALARCLDWAAIKGFIAQNPLRLLPKRYASGHKDEVERDRRLSHEEEAEVKRILLGGKPKDRERPFELKHGEALMLLFILALETGMRMREIFTLSADQIDLDNRTIFLDKTKNGDKRQVPLTSVALDALKDHKHDGLLFPWWDGRQETLKSVTALLSQQFSRVFDAAGCGEFTFHGLRHEATCRFYERTRLTDVQIAKILGWRSLKVALRYSNLRASDLSASLW
jgi:integrase